MSFKTKEEMFGDNGAHGTAVPYGTSNPPGTGTANRGIGYGEQLTAEIANRPHYALCLNDEDLNTRLSSFEVGGLNAAYRLGTVAVAGGGRSVTVDGGAIETSYTLATASSYPVDKANAHIRINTYASTSKGSTGIDFTAKSGSLAEGGAQYSYIDRRAMAFSGVTVFARAQAVTLNPSGTAYEIQVGGGAQFTDGTNTELLPGIDMIEILSGATRGLYLIKSITSQFIIQAVLLNDTNASFAGAEAATATIYRPIAAIGGSWGKIAGPTGNTEASSTGLVLVGERATAEDASSPLAPLTLVAGGRDGTEGAVTAYGHRYAMRVLRYTKPGAKAFAGGITGDGGFVNFLRDGQNYTSAVGTDRAGVYIATSGSATKRSIGVMVHAKESPVTKDVLGVSTALRGPTLALAVSLAHGAAQGVLTSTPTLMTTEGRPAPGALFEILTPSNKAGVYKIAAGTGLSTYEFKLETDDGATPDFDAAVGITGCMLYGSTSGNVQATIGTTRSLTYEDGTQLPDIHKAAVGVMSHEAATETSRGCTNLALYNCSKYDSAFLRCFKGENEKFTVRKSGDIATAGSILSAGRIRTTGGDIEIPAANDYKYSTNKGVTDAFLPLGSFYEMMNTSNAAVKPSTWKKSASYIEYDPSGVNDMNPLYLDINGLVPYGATITNAKLYFILTDVVFSPGCVTFDVVHRAIGALESTDKTINLAEHTPVYGTDTMTMSPFTLTVGRTTTPYSFRVGPAPAYAGLMGSVTMKILALKVSFYITALNP